jgi:nicotinamide phosphoribosyltransferase
MKLSHNIILNSDSYKYSQFNQYPLGTEYVYSYIESRGGEWDKTVFFGLQAFIKEYLTTPITQADIDVAEAIILAHGEPFNRAGWEYILKEHGGKLPVVIKAAPEGCIIPTKNVLATIENTDPKCYWLTSFLETAILRAIWYPTTVATNSYESKKIILAALEKTGDPSLIDFKLHDFGARGVSSQESAGLGDAAHLINFLGTDTITGLLYAREYYDAEMPGFSIPAMEHSTVTSWGQEHEVDSYRNMLKQNGKPGGILACVSDSYDIYEACKLWGTVLKDDVIKSGATVVIRPDSGYPSDVVVKCLQILDHYYGSVVNAKGYKVLNTVRVIQGDGIDHATIRSILVCMDIAGYSADNIAFGQGGALLQQVNRDTMKFAMKCSAIGIREEWLEDDGSLGNKLVWRPVFKDPVTDPGKVSKKGRVTLYKENGRYFTGVEDWPKSALNEVFRDGIIGKTYTFDEVRANARSHV